MKTALEYAKESIDWYKKNSIRNPDNRQMNISSNDYEKWEEFLSRESMNIKLDTILERLPYETQVKKDPFREAIYEIASTRLGTVDDYIRVAKQAIDDYERIKNEQA